MSKEITLPVMPILIQDLGAIFATNKSKKRERYGMYQCYCGNIFRARILSVNNTHTNSCGCYGKQRSSETHYIHGLRNHRLYSTWYLMVQRTNNKNYNRFKEWGGRGIKVCKRWMSIENFIEDMYPTFKEGLTIDRINNDGNYEPSNCRWATKEVQARNSRKIYSHNTSGFRGVGFHKKADRWRAQIYINNKQKYLGLFDTALEAAKAYDTYVIKNELEHTINNV